MGFTELRFKNEEVIGNIDQVISAIQDAASRLPSLQGGVGGRLLLGPFQGTVACYSIPYGKGVCGTAWKERKTLVVPDVEEFPGHIACSSLSRSEIVVPIFVKDGDDEQGDVWGVIDIDSTELNTFDEVDAKFLEQIAAILSKSLATDDTDCQSLL
ncbi:MAG: GAF domain-containing protein [Prevotella sp.]|nr:GAF domain-containing protein [Prevotella sp.]